MKILIIILMFFAVSALMMISNNNLALCKQEHAKLFFELYSEWMNQVYLNVQMLTGEIVKLNWLPK